MIDEARTLTGRWLYAAKPMSWPKILVPALLGQAIGVAAIGRISYGALGFGLLFTTFDILFIVWLNDWGDRDVDTLKRRMFPTGCSPKTIPDGILPARAVLTAGLAAGALALTSAAAASLVLGRPWLLPVAVLALLLYAAYTFGPVRLNYRGGGELLEALGVGGVTLWLNAYAQTGQPWHFVMTAIVPGAVLMALASALASGLSDEQSDRAGGKCTFTTMCGNATVRRAVGTCLFAGWAAWLCAAPLAGVPLWVIAPPCLWAATRSRDVRILSNSAVTGAFGPLNAYKRALHAALWGSHLLLAGLLLVWSAVR